MLTYWLMFLVPVCASIAASSRPRAPARRLPLSWLVTGVLVTLLVGLRHQVGGDWNNYQEHYLYTVDASLAEVLQGSDPGYYLLNWLSSRVDGGIYLVNLAAAGLFSWGLVAFCRQQPRPWLALAVAMPYMVTVVAMGYSRQGVALGLAMLALVYLTRTRNLRFAVCVAIAATFHKSAVVFVPLALLAATRGRLWTAMWVALLTAVLYYLLLAQSVERLFLSYIEAEYQSQGAAVRIAMNALPAALLLLFRKRFTWPAAERNLWVSMALLALACVVWLLVSPSSTAVDRVALYLIPIQLYVFSRLPDLVGRGKGIRTWVLAAVAYYAAVLFVWLNYAIHAYAWLPYKSYFFL